MTDKSPFVLTRVTCPICRTVNEYETIRPGAFTETGSDSDFCPLGRKWANPRFDGVNPLLYFMATCATCFFTREFNNEFRSGSTTAAFDPAQKPIRQRHLIQLADDSAVMKRLSESLWPASHPLETAINKLLIGILDEHLMDRPCDTNLGRWYLRIAWLFRDLQTTVDSGHSRQTPRGQLSGALDEILVSLMRAHSRAVETADAVASPRAGEMETRIPSETIDNLHESSRQLDSLIRAFLDIRRTCELPIEQVIGGHEGSRRSSYGGYVSYTQFLAALHMDSPAIPTNEHEALALALVHYKRALDSCATDVTANGALVTSYVTGEIARRLSRVEDARHYLVLARRAGEKAIEQHGADKPRSALARHIVQLADRQIGRLEQLTDARSTHI